MKRRIAGVMFFMKQVAIRVVALLIVSAATANAQLAPIRGQCIALDRNRILLRNGEGEVMYGLFDKKLEKRLDIDGVVAVAMSGNFNGATPIMLRNDGTVWQWSWQGTTHFNLVQVKDLANAVQIAQENGTSVALLADGTVREWKRIGGPAKRLEGVTDVTAIAGGDNLYLLRRDGSVRVRGWIRRSVHMESKRHGLMATLGTGTLDDAEQPKPIAGLEGTVKQISSIGDVKSAISSDGRTVWAWGSEQGHKAPPHDFEGGSYYPSNVALRVAQLTASGRTPVTVLRKVALFDDGTLMRWFNAHSETADIPLKDVVSVATNGLDVSTFAALHSDGRLVLFGYGENNEPRVVAQLGSKMAADCAVNSVAIPDDVPPADFTPADPSAKTGIVERWYGVTAFDPRGPRISKSDSAAFAAEIIKLRDAVNSAPTLVKRHGFDLRPLADMQIDEGFPLFGKYWFQTFRLPRYRGAHSYVSGTFVVNPGISDMVRSKAVARDDATTYWLELKPHDRHAKYLDFDKGINRITVVTKRTEPWVIPVTQEFWLLRAIELERKSLAKLAANQGTPTGLQRARESLDKLEKSVEAEYERQKKTNPEAAEAFKAKQLKDLAEARSRLGDDSYEISMRNQQHSKASERLNMLESKLAAMSPEEKAEPARYCVTDPLLPGECGPDKGRVIVRANPDFYDRSLPKTAMQAIVIHYMFTESSKWLAEAIHNDLDLDRIAALLK